MPKYTFSCPTCKKDIKKYTASSVESTPCECGHTMKRQMPTINKASVTEVVDSYTGVALPLDNAEILKERKDDYFWEHEVPRLVGKYSVAHCLQNGWLYVDEKNQLQVQTKPPHRR
jgi:hypothetical protein